MPGFPGVSRGSVNSSFSSLAHTKLSGRLLRFGGWLIVEPKKFSESVGSVLLAVRIGNVNLPAKRRELPRLGDSDRRPEASRGDRLPIFRSVDRECCHLALSGFRAGKPAVGTSPRV